MTGVQTCALPICVSKMRNASPINALGDVSSLEDAGTVEAIKKAV